MESAALSSIVIVSGDSQREKRALSGDKVRTIGSLSFSDPIMLMEYRTYPGFTLIAPYVY